MQTTTHYLALSLGPIYDTIRQARKTRELWLASYLFSFLMKQLVAELSKRDFSVIAPHGVDALDPDKLFGAGVYPDRLFATTTAANEQAVEKAIDAALGKLVDQTSSATPPRDFKGDATRWRADREAYWRDYLRIVYTLRPASEIDAADNILFRLNHYLDTLELQPSYFAQAPEHDLLIRLLDQPYSYDLHATGLSGDPGAYKGLVDPKRFPSTSDVAALELYQLMPETFHKIKNEAARAVAPEEGERDDSDSEVIAEFYHQLTLKEAGEEADRALKGKARDYHRYLCIVHADGDRFGKTIEKLRDTEAIEAFSQKLAEFATIAAQTINDYGGRPVYIGGDDLLFLAPVKCRHVEAERGTVTVFDLLAELDEKFATLELSPQPTLSYGITISHYKFPLFEALQLSAEQLFSVAKQVSTGPESTKNAVAFRLIKHSGSYFEGVLTKELLKQLNSFGRGDQDFPDELLSSFAYKLRTLEALIGNMARASVAEGGDTRQETDFTALLQPLFDNYFNEPIHQRYRAHTNAVRKLAAELFSTPIRYGDTPVETARNLYAILRILNFTY